MYKSISDLCPKPPRHKASFELFREKLTPTKHHLTPLDSYTTYTVTGRLCLLFSINSYKFIGVRILGCWKNVQLEAVRVLVLLGVTP